MSSSELQSSVDAKRDELASTLDQLGDKLNVPKQVSELTRKAQAAYEENPVPWIVAAASVAAAVVGLVAWALLSDDD